MSTKYQTSHLTENDKRALKQYFRYYPNAVPSLVSLVKWARRLLEKVKQNKMQHATVLRYFQSLKNYFKYYGIDSQVFRHPSLIKLLDFALRRIPVRYTHKYRYTIYPEDLERAAKEALTTGNPTDVMTVTFAIVAFTSLARTHELVHAPRHQPLTWANVHQTRNQKYRFLLQQPKTHKGYNQYLEPFNLHHPINPHQWIERLKKITGGSGIIFNLLLNSARPTTRSMLNNFGRLAQVNPKLLDSSSFRAGGATYLLQKGCSDAQIMRFGRWDSKAYTRYLRTLDDAFCNL